MEYSQELSKGKGWNCLGNAELWILLQWKRFKKNSICFLWFAPSSQQHLLRVVSERNSLLWTGIILTNIGLTNTDKWWINEKQKTAFFLHKLQFHVLLRTLQKQRVTFEVIQPPTNVNGFLTSWDWFKH